MTMPLQSLFKKRTATSREGSGRRTGNNNERRKLALGSNDGSWLGGSLDYFVFGGVNGGLNFGGVGLLGIEGDGSVSAHVADFVDVDDSFGFSEDGGEMIAARLAGEAGDLERGLVSFDL